MDIKNIKDVKNIKDNKTLRAAIIPENEKFLEYCDFCNGLQYSIFGVRVVTVIMEDSSFNAFLCPKHITGRVLL